MTIESKKRAQSMGDEKNFIDFINDYMKRTSRLNNRFGEVIKRLLNRTEAISFSELQNPTDENIDAALARAEEYCALTEMIFTFGASCAAYYTRQEEPDIEDPQDQN